MPIKIIFLALIAISFIIKIIKLITNKNKPTPDFVKATIKVKPIKEIFENEEHDTLAYDMYDYIGKKCNYGDNLENLNEKQRVIYNVLTLEGEVNNGGFPQYFFNSSGDTANELVDSFEEISAHATAEICKKAISIYGDQVPLDREKREERLLADDEDEIEAILIECDDAFFEYPDNIAELCYQYIINNKSYFSE